MTTVAEISNQIALDPKDPWVVWTIFDLDPKQEMPKGDGVWTIYEDITKANPKPLVGWRYDPKAKTFKPGVQPRPPAPPPDPPKPIPIRLELTAGEFWVRWTPAEANLLSTAISAPKAGGSDTLLRVWYDATIRGPVCLLTPAGAAYQLVTLLRDTGAITSQRWAELLAGIAG